MRVAIYARYSSENQSEKSIDDQIRVWSEPSSLNMPPAYLDSSNSCRLKLIVYGGGGGIRTLEAGNPPPNRLAGGPIQPLLHSSNRIINEYQ